MLSVNCISLIIGYITDLPKLPFEEELLEKTIMIRQDLSFCSYNTTGFYNMSYESYHDGNYIITCGRDGYWDIRYNYNVIEMWEDE